MSGRLPAIGSVLAANPWFTDLPPAATQRMVAMAQRRVYEDGGLIHAKGDEPAGIMAVLTGRVMVSSGLADGQEAILTYLEPGQWFGEIAMFDGQPRTHDARAVGQCTLLLLPRVEFHRMLADLPALYPHFLRLLCQRLRMAFAFIEDAALLPFPARLAKRLLQLADSYGEAHPHGVLINLHLPQEHLGTMLAASRQTVNKELKAWERQGWARIEYGRLIIRRDPLATLVRQAEDGG